MRSSSKPAWLNLDSATGRIWGTPSPTTANSFTFTLIVRDINDAQSKSVTIPLDRWGPNATGWNVTIDNRTSLPLSFEGFLYSWNIYHSPRSLRRSQPKQGSAERSLGSVDRRISLRPITAVIAGP